MSLERILISKEEETEEQWISISDLMSVLMVIFLFIAVIYVNKSLDKAKEFQLLEEEILNDLKNEFKNDLDKWQAVINDETLTISFTKPSVFFETGKSEVKEAFKNILSDFFPRYLDVLKKYKNDIEEIRIEGHTSSKWEIYEGLTPSEDKAYFLNMKLSQDRTREVLSYSLSLENIINNKQWAKNLITANGLSSSKLIFTNGKENEKLSQRVDFRVKANSLTVLRDLIKKEKPAQ